MKLLISIRKKIDYQLLFLIVKNNKREKMKIKLLNHDVVLRVEHYDAKTKVATVKMFGTMCKFQEHEYEVVEDVQ